jgi:hypothetical protein
MVILKRKRKQAGSFVHKTVKAIDSHCFVLRTKGVLEEIFYFAPIKIFECMILPQSGKE